MDPHDFPSPNRANLPEWSVSELSGALKRTLEEGFSQVRVRGELGKVTVHTSGHVYLDIKDDKSTLSSVIWRGQAARLRFRPEMGLEVIATGKITTFAGQSRYQLIIEQLEPAGEGALLAQLEERKRRLAALGLFDDARKQLLPFLPQVIGVITSPTGAVIRDILHRLSDRFPRHVLVWPVRVQGETCAQEVANAIEGFNALSEQGPIPRPDVLIVARGGGSIEDLWGFNDERVVQAAAASMIPLVSAVGHETDWTLIDLAADQRAPTPTGAAEMIVPVRADLLLRLRDLGLRLQGGMQRLIVRRRGDFQALVRAMPQAADFAGAARQRLDLAGSRLVSGLSRSAQRQRQRFMQIQQRLQRHAPVARLGTARARLEGLEQRLKAAQSAQIRAERRLVIERRQRVGVLVTRQQQAMGVLLKRQNERLGHLSQMLVGYSYQAILGRGFALVLDEAGHPVKSAQGVRTGSVYTVQFADGQTKVTGR
jgi:exodeoxyribonuclease VII large subunit